MKDNSMKNDVPVQLTAKGEEVWMFEMVFGRGSLLKWDACLVKDSVKVRSSRI